jgi:phosphatidate cytidylyltransferase
MKRLLTALVALPLALAAVFWLPPAWFFVAMVLLVAVAVLEYARLGKQAAAGVPLQALVLAVPLAAWLGCFEIPGSSPGEPGWTWMFFAAAIVPLGFGSLVLLSRAPLAQSLAGLGLLAFGLPYFALPIISLTLLEWADPWMLMLMLALVWLGDSFAFYFGTRWGRHKMAPVVSPHKSWEGAAAGFLGSMLVALAFHLWRPGHFGLQLMPLAAVTAMAAQVGDLVESMIKRAAGVKDSGSLLPGHGGVFDRIDALLFAAPVWYLGLRALGMLKPGG